MADSSKAVVIPLPTAAAEPVANPPRGKGRTPKVVVPAYRLKFMRGQKELDARKAEDCKKRTREVMEVHGVGSTIDPLAQLIAERQQYRILHETYKRCIEDADIEIARLQAAKQRGP